MSFPFYDFESNMTRTVDILPDVDTKLVFRTRFARMDILHEGIFNGKMFRTDCGVEFGPYDVGWWRYD